MCIGGTCYIERAEAWAAMVGVGRRTTTSDEPERVGSGLRETARMPES